jgi:hypothetical protein
MYNVRDDAYRFKGMYDQDLLDYNKALLLDPKLADAYVGCGNVFANTSMNEKSSSSYICNT